MKINYSFFNIQWQIGNDSNEEQIKQNLMINWQTFNMSIKLHDTEMTKMKIKGVNRFRRGIRWHLCGIWYDLSVNSKMYDLYGRFGSVKAYQAI